MTLRRHIPFAVFIAAIAVYPAVFRDQFAIGAGITVAGFAIGTVGLVLLLGLAHQLAIGQAAFYMVGGYGSAILTTRYGWDGASAAMASATVSILLAYIVGWPIVQLRGFVLAIASFTLHLLFIALAILLVDFTGGAAGISDVPRLSLGPWIVHSDLAYYFVSWLLVAVMIVIGHNIDRSQVGRALRAVAADEAGAAASGIATGHYKLMIFVISAGMASIGGSVLVHFLRVIDPTVFGLQFSVDIITAVIVGGLYSVWGGVLGAGAIVVVRELLRLAEQPAWEVVVMGGLTVVILLWFRSGIAGALSTALGFKRTDFTDVAPLSVGSPERFRVARAAAAEGPLLRIEGVSRSFGDLRAVSNVSFSVNQGNIVALIGPNGAGKTTMLDMIAGYRGLSAGKIFFRDREVSAAMPNAIARSGIARTFQTIRIFDNMSVLENVMCGAHARGRSNLVSICMGLPGARTDDRVMADIAGTALDFVGLTDVAAHNPAELPFGHQRMMELARAIASSPQVLILDEPASGLNDAESEALAHLLIRMRDLGMTILLVEHDIRLVMGLAGKIVVMDHGEKIADGPVSVVRNDPQVISAYLGLAA